MGNGQQFATGGNSIPLSKSMSVTIGFLIDPGSNPTLTTNGFLNGAAVQGGACDGICAFITHSVGGTTGLEIGIGTPGPSGSYTTSKPVGGPKW